MLTTRKAQRAIERAIKTAGERIAVRLDRALIASSAVVQNSGKNFMRKYDNDGTAVDLSGVARSRDKVAFLPYLSGWEKADSIEIRYRGAWYRVLADSVMNLGDEPAYIWVLIAEKHAPDSSYYDDLNDHEGGD